MNPEQKPTDPKEPMLRITLSIAVPWRMLDIAERGGITEQDVARVKSYLGDLTGPKGTDLFFKSEKKGETAERLNQLADAIAVMAFLPGGITSFGQHYDGATMLAYYARRQQLGAEAEQLAHELRPALESEQRGGEQNNE